VASVRASFSSDVLGQRTITPTPKEVRTASPGSRSPSSRKIVFLFLFDVRPRTQFQRTKASITGTLLATTTEHSLYTGASAHQHTLQITMEDVNTENRTTDKVTHGTQDSKVFSTGSSSTVPVLQYIEVQRRTTT
jgi:microcompartment protein CcmK/EutM